MRITRRGRRLPILLALLAAAPPALAGAGSPAAAAFKKLLALEGHWEGKDAQGRVVKSTFQTIAARTAAGWRRAKLYVPSCYISAGDGDSETLFRTWSTAIPHYQHLPPR